MISRSMPSVSMIRLRADVLVQLDEKTIRSLMRRTLEVDPKVVGVEDLELADC